MRHRSPLLASLIAVLTACALTFAAPMSSAAVTSSPQVGLNLDIARRYWSPAAIKTLVAHHAAAGGTYLHLHASDDQSYGIESSLLGQSAGSAMVTGTRYVNRRTSRPFLTTAQLRDIRSYASSLGVETFLEVDTPGHMRGIRLLMERFPRPEYPVSKVFSAYAPYELDVHSSTAWAFAKALYTEVSGVLPGARVHIGGDEFAGGNAEHIAWAKYANMITAQLRSKSVPGVLAWNDGLTSTTLGVLTKEITITYWNYDVWGPPGAKSTMPTILGNGFRVLNYNGYYQYWVPSPDEPQSDRDYTINDLRTKWHRGLWTQTQSVSPSDTRIVGAAFSIWGEDASGMSDQLLIERGTPILRAFAARAAAPY